MGVYFVNEHAQNWSRYVTEMSRDHHMTFCYMFVCMFCLVFRLDLFQQWQVYHTDELLLSLSLCIGLVAATLLGKEILVCGGKGDQEIINMAEAYDSETDLWEPVVSVMNHARVGFGQLLARDGCRYNSTVIELVEPLHSVIYMS